MRKLKLVGQSGEQRDAYAAAQGEEIDPRPVVLLEEGQRPQSIDDVLAALDFPGNLFYQQGGRLVRVTQIATAPGAAREGDIHRPDGGTVTAPVDARWLAVELDRLIRFRRKRYGEWVDTDCPMWLAEAIITRGEWPANVPVLRGLVGAPLLRPNGLSVLPPARGYDPESGFYLTIAPPADYTEPPDRPTRADALAALETLKECISTWPFVSDADHAAAVAAIITAILRRLFPAAPIFVITAYAAGTGKSTLADVLAIIANNRRAPVMAYPDDQAELEKRLSALILAGESMVVLDNIECLVRSSYLCQISTQPAVTIRPLFSATTVAMPTDITVIMDGNNVSLAGDVTRRANTIRLDAGTERPDRRVFDRDPLAYVRQHRGRLITAALTVVRAYIAAGCPAVDATPYGSFGDWDRWVRRPLLWLGAADPLGAADAMRDEDPDLAAMRGLYSAWWDCYADAEKSAADVIRDARSGAHRLDGGDDYRDLRDALQLALGDRIDPRTLGYWLRRHRGRIIDKRKVEAGRGDSHAKKTTWRMVLCG